MQYTIQKISETRIRCTITASEPETRSFIDTALREKKKEAPDGFSVTTAAEDDPFLKKITERAMQLLTSAFIRQALQKEDLRPVTRPVLTSSGRPAYGSDFRFTVEVDILPALSFPQDLGSISINVREPDVPPHRFYEAIERLMRPLIKLEEVQECRMARPGDVADITVEADADGIPVPGISAARARIALNAMPDDGPLRMVEEAAKKLLPGEKYRGEMLCPDDFPWASLRGKKIRVEVTLHGLMHRNVPVLTDETAKKLGYQDAKTLKSRAYMDTMNRCILSRKQEATEKLLAVLPGISEIPVPESLIRLFYAEAMQDLAAFLKRGSLMSDAQVQTAMEDSREQVMKNAEENARRHTWLLAYACSHGLAATEKDLEEALDSIAKKSRKSLEETRKYFEESGMLDSLEDRIMADKAMEKIYSLARKTVVDAQGRPVPPPLADTDEAK